MEKRKNYILLVVLLMLSCFLTACNKENTVIKESLTKEIGEVDSEIVQNSVIKEAASQWEKGYDLPVEDAERVEAETDCNRMMELISDIYKHADKGDASNVVLSKETVLNMQNKITESGYPCTSMMAYSSMGNYEDVDRFLKNCQDGIKGSIVIYEVHYDGGIRRMKYSFDGVNLFVFTVRSAWNYENNSGIAFISYHRIKEWSYTDKGWFCYEMCVPEPPEVTEIVDGSYLIRIKPYVKELREMSKKCVEGLGYQGNNLLCSNWNLDHMEDLDYNGMFEYLYEMKYQQKLMPESYLDGIPKEEFERLIMEYLPVTLEQIRDWAIFDEENQTYVWSQLGCFNYDPTYFGTSLPEVTKIRENEDGSFTLTVDAVCDVVVCNDAVITHELRVRFAEDGSFRYIGNKILDDGIKNIPEYQYRVKSIIG